MLAKGNRIVRADDYKATVRTGRRTGSALAVVYVRSRPDETRVRFGFIVAKTVGNAVVRNLVRRRLKSIAAELLPSVRPGTDIVVRALPGASQAGWATLRAQIDDVLTRGVARA